MYKILAKTLILGKKVVFLPSCHSTNEYANDLTKTSNALEGTVVITNNQMAGRGQMGNRWEAEPGENLTFSIILKPNFLKVEKQFLLTMAVALGLVEYLNELTAGFNLKWPNDIYFDGKKVAGILIQNAIKSQYHETSVVGIGLNVNQKDFSYPSAISLYNITGQQYGLQEMLEEVSYAIEKRYLQLKFGETDLIKQDYLQHLLGFGTERLYDDGKLFNGRITDVLDNGLLEVERNEGVRHYNFKELKFVFGDS